MQNSIESTPRLFADDTAILIDANSTFELEIKLNEDLARVSIWMNKNQLTLNSLKSHALVISPLLNEEHTTINISLNACTIKNSECIKYLGILLDSKLNFRNHINVLQDKLLRAVEIMSKLRHSMPSNILKRLYFAFFHSHLLHCLIMWSATGATLSYLDSLKKLQNRAIRIITNADRFENGSPLYRNLENSSTK